MLDSSKNPNLGIRTFSLVLKISRLELSKVFHRLALYSSPRHLIVFKCNAKEEITRIFGPCYATFKTIKLTKLLLFLLSWVEVLI